MSRDQRKPSTWTHRHIQTDPVGYANAQRAAAEDERTARERRVEEDALRFFTESYVANGGDAADAQDAFRRQRAEHAARAAGDADEQARRVYRSETLRRI